MRGVLPVLLLFYSLTGIAQTFTNINAALPACVGYKANPWAYWTVQSIEHAFAGSPFASWQMVNVVGINEKPASQYIMIYPNPFTEYTELRYDLTSSQQAQIIITDAVGRTVRDRAVTLTPAIRIEREELPAGTYYFTLIEKKSIPGRGVMIITD